MKFAGLPQWDHERREKTSRIDSGEAGDTYEHTIKKSEPYYGKKVIYYAPFNKCDRVEGYKVAWTQFEKIFKEKA